MTKNARKYDVIVWGATGFTGRLVAEYIYQQYGGNQQLKWAMAGRNFEKLEKVRSMVAGQEVPLIVANSKDIASLKEMAAQTKVICTTVGPYAQYGSELVAACIETGTDYCDLTGEVQWMRRMIDQHHQAAKEKEVKIVHTCGFDSIPSDMGVYFLQKETRAKKGVFCQKIDMRVRAMKGAMSGGTYASLNNVMKEAMQDKSIWKVLKNPYGLNPEGAQTGPDQPDLTKVVYDPVAKSWIAPFVMAGINTKVVRRSHALADFPYGKDFGYSEAILTGDGFSGRIKGLAGAAGLGLMMAKPGSLVKNIVDRFLPEPGEGPDRAARESGFYKLLFFGHLPNGEQVLATVKGDRDPGYGSTSKMLAESAICLAKDNLPKKGGMLTPSVAMGDFLLNRLQSNAGLTFEFKS